MQCPSSYRHTFLLYCTWLFLQMFARFLHCATFLFFNYLLPIKVIPLFVSSLIVQYLKQLYL